MRPLILALLLAGCATASSHVAPTNPAVARAEVAMQQLTAQGFAGSVLVACGERIVFSGDYGLTPQGTPPSYWVASMSKQFTAAAILKLAEQGRLRLDDPLGRYFQDVPADKAGITLMQLLTHRSGLRQAYAADGLTDRDAAARAILSGDLAARPGEAFTYSNDNFTLLAMIVEQVSGRSFEDYVAREVFAPAGLRNAGFWPDAGSDFVPPILEALTGEVSQANWGFRGGIGMRVSASDLLAWANALDEGRVLSAESVAMLYGPHSTMASGTQAGMGWFWSDERGGRWLWSRGYEMFGGNAVLYRLSGTPLIIIAATNAGPAEGAGPGWSRSARDAMQDIFDASTCAG